MTTTPMPKKKLDVYNSNAADKLKAYNDNHTEKMTAYDTNATDKLSTYNSNAEQTQEAYNSNHTEKLTEYNTNAETKTAEFDSNAAALQTEVDRLRSECDQLSAENRKQENRIDALMKLNKGQTYDILAEEGETASRTAPSGAKYVSVDKVGGKSVVWNQLVKMREFTYEGNGLTIVFSNGVATINGTATDNTNINFLLTDNFLSILKSNKYLVKGVSGGSTSTYRLFIDNIGAFVGERVFTSREDFPKISIKITVYKGYTADNIVIKPQLFNLTQMFGAGNEPSTVEEFEAMFPADYYPYSEPTIISSQTDRVDVATADSTVTQQITTGFPVLNSAGSVYDYIDLNEGKLHRRVGEFILAADADISLISYTEDTGIYLYQFMLAVNNTPDDMPNICNRFTYYAYNDRGVAWKTDGAIVSNRSGITRLATKMNKDELKTFLSTNEVIIQYVLTEPVITDIEIPTELTDWLEVEAGGTVTFRNADESKQLPVPNAVSWVRKLDEVN